MLTMTGPLDPSRLQWGHDFSAVEMPITQCTIPDGLWLQWGHDFSAVEIIHLGNGPPWP